MDCIGKFRGGALSTSPQGFGMGCTCVAFPVPHGLCPCFGSHIDISDLQ